MLAQWACIVTMSQEKYIVELKMFLLILYFSNSLIIHHVKTKKITSAKEVCMSDLN